MTIRLINEDFIKNIKFFIIPIILVISLYSNYLIRFKNIKFFKMNTYTKFLVKTYLLSFLNVFFIFFCLIYILNLLTELEFFKQTDVGKLIFHFIYHL